jgi:hypothetical protein
MATNIYIRRCYYFIKVNLERKMEIDREMQSKVRLRLLEIIRDFPAWQIERKKSEYGYIFLDGTFSYRVYSGFYYSESYDGVGGERNNYYGWAFYKGKFSKDKSAIFDCTEDSPWEAIRKKLDALTKQREKSAEIEKKKREKNLKVKIEHYITKRGEK